jgi:glycosidase
MQKQLLTFIFCAISLGATAQDALFQSWYWEYPTTQNGLKWVPYLNTKMPELQAAGFKYIWLPPLSRGTGATSMGYDIQDYFDLGKYRSTRWGNRTHLSTIKQTADALDMKLVGDLVYNHRDGGKPEDNAAVKGWVTNYTYAKVQAGDSPYPSDRMRSFIAIGGTTAHGAGDYYIKIKSNSNHPNFAGKLYLFSASTNKTPIDGNGVTQESEFTGGNGGGDCGQVNQPVVLGRRILATIDNPAGCNIDEFKVTIAPNQFNAAGDTLWFNLGNVSSAGGTFGGANLGDMSDHIVYGIWHVRTGDPAGHAIAAGDLTYQTNTEFTAMASGRGAMNHLSFRPNGGPTCLCGDPAGMFFFYDLDQERQATRDTLFAYTRFMFQNAGIKGMRVDAVKHFSNAFMGDLLDNLHQNGISPELVVGESYDYSANVLKNWVDGVEANMDAATKQAVKVKIFDFALREQMRQACDAFGYDVRNLFTSGCADGAGMSGLNVVSFVNNHDFREVAQQIQNDPILPYAYILTNIRLGLPSVYYPDYYGPNNMRGDINALLKAHKRYIKGATNVTYLNKIGQSYPHSFNGGYPNTTLSYQVRGGTGASDVVVALNFAGERMRLTQEIDTNTLSVGDTLTDIFAVSGTPIVIVNAQKQITMEVPARSFGVWVKGDKRNQLISLTDTLYIGTENTEALAQNGHFETLKVFPNPFENAFTFGLAMQTNTNGIIALQNTLGQAVWHDTIALQAGMNTYELKDIPTDLPKGVYFLSLFTNGKLYRQKVVKG